MSDQKEVTIVLVEDDLGHARLIEKNLRAANVHNPIVHLSDGQQAVDFLFSQGAYASQPRPTPLLVLLDLNMPILDGYQVLERMKRNEATRRIPVIVLTTTNDAREISRCYELGCNIYITKPVNYQQFSEAIHNLGLFVSIMSLPNGE